MWPSGHVKIEMEALSIAHQSTMCQWVKIDAWRISCTVCSRFLMRNIAWLLFISSTFYYHGLTLIPAWICNWIHHKVWIEITYPFLNFNDATVEYLEWMINFIPHITRHVITYPCRYRRQVHARRSRAPYDRDFATQHIRRRYIWFPMMQYSA